MANSKQMASNLSLEERRNLFAKHIDAIYFIEPKPFLDLSKLSFPAWRSKLIQSFAEDKKSKDPNSLLPSRSRLDRMIQDKKAIDASPGIILEVPEGYKGTPASYKNALKHEYEVKDGTLWENDCEGRKKGKRALPVERDAVEEPAAKRRAEVNQMGQALPLHDFSVENRPSPVASPHGQLASPSSALFASGSPNPNVGGSASNGEELQSFLGRQSPKGSIPLSGPVNHPDVATSSATPTPPLPSSLLPPFAAVLFGDTGFFDEHFAAITCDGHGNTGDKCSDRSS
ncbi:predicted protein [Botrytis cinerea T4]|uniref:Uncharacterized protein n=1 Tax=Botryotinia fuckeliana (strain T4) TaxID=999810 RepID=G2YIJ2_BOTF4|nr:predicted protein [Botrytis cinerea T4]